MQSVWRGAISFGLVSIPVRLYVAVQEKSMRFHHLHGTDKGRIRYQRVCSICGEDFFSHRRDAGVTGRQAGVVWRR